MKGVKSADSYFTIELTATTYTHDWWMELSKCNWVAKVTPFKPTMKPPTHDATLLLWLFWWRCYSRQTKSCSIVISLPFSFCFYLLKGDTWAPDIAAKLKTGCLNKCAEFDNSYFLSSFNRCFHFHGTRVNGTWMKGCAMEEWSRAVTCKSYYKRPL